MDNEGVTTQKNPSMLRRHGSVHQTQLQQLGKGSLYTQPLSSPFRVNCRHGKISNASDGYLDAE